MLVRSHPIMIDKKRFLLLFLQDITLQQQRAALERAFFHDVNNMLSTLLGASELLITKFPSNLSEMIHKACVRLNKEIAIQRCLSQSEDFTYQPLWHTVNVDEIISELKSFFLNHPTARGKHVEFQKNYQNVSITTDTSLLLRVLSNMLINALEATEEGGTVKVWIEQHDNNLSFYVWNAQEIPKDVALRIFQRNFSTKGEPGRGIGTFSMKLFGEKILGGQIRFTTSSEIGTTFKFTLPIGVTST